MPRVTLIGYRGTGKSTVAALLGDILGCGWCDADIVLEQRVGRSIASLVRERGEPFFRDEESAVLAELLRRVDGVLSTGGGVVLRPENRQMLRTAGRPIVWLTATSEVIRQRLAADPTTAGRRPALATPTSAALTTAGDPLVEVAAALEHREPYYRACADLQVDSSIMTPATIATRIAAWLNTAAARPSDKVPGADDHRPGACS